MPFCKANNNSLWLSSSHVSSLSSHYQALKVLCTKQMNRTDFFFPSLPTWRFLDARSTTAPLNGPQAPQHPVVVTPSQNREGTTEHCLQNQAVPGPKWQPGPKTLLDSETDDPPAARDTSTAICFLWGLSSDSYSFMFFKATWWFLRWYSKPSTKIWLKLQRVQMIRIHKLSSAIKCCTMLLIELYHTDSAYRNAVLFWL